MDPLSLIAGVISVSGAAIAASSALFDLVDTVRNAPAEITAISRDTHAFLDIVSSLETSLRDPTITEGVVKNANIMNAVTKLKEPLDNCVRILAQVDAKLRSHLKPIAGGGWKVSTVDVKWYFVRTDVKELIFRFESTKQTLDTALGLVVFLCSLRSTGEDPTSYGNAVVSGQRRTSETGTDAGYALKRWAASIAPGSPSISDSFDNKLKLSHPDWSEITPSDSISTRQVERPPLKQDPSSDALERLRKRENQRAGFHKAARDGDDLILEMMLEEGTDVDIRAADGRTALHLIAEKGNELGARLLLDHGAKLNAVSYTKGSAVERKFGGGRTPLHWAAEYRQLGMIKLLVEAGADMGIQNASGRSVLQESIKDSGFSADAIAKFLIHAGAPLFTKDDEDWTALHQASQDGQTELTRILLDKGLDFEAVTANQNVWNLSVTKHATPLLLAVHKGRTQTVQFLISRGANVQAANYDGDQSIHIACYYGYLPLVKILLDAGVDIETRDSGHNETPLLKAASTGKTDVVRYLLQRGADTRAETDFGRNALVHCQLHEKGKHGETVRVIKKWMQEHGQALEVNEMLLPQFRDLPSPLVHPTEG